MLLPPLIVFITLYSLSHNQVYTRLRLTIVKLDRSAMTLGPNKPNQPTQKLHPCNRHPNIDPQLSRSKYKHIKNKVVEQVLELHRERWYLL